MGSAGVAAMVAAQELAGVGGSGSVRVVCVDAGPGTSDTRYQPACGTTSLMVIDTVVVPSALGVNALMTPDGPLNVPLAKVAPSLPHGAVFSGVPSRVLVVAQLVGVWRTKW